MRNLMGQALLKTLAKSLASGCNNFFCVQQCGHVGFNPFLQQLTYKNKAQILSLCIKT